MSENVLKVVCGKEITEKDLEATIAKFPKERQGMYRTEEGRGYLIDQIVCFELLFNHAIENKFDQDSEFQLQLDNVKKELLIQFTVNKLLGEVQVSEDELKNYYEANKEKFKNPELVTASHILVKSENEAEEIIEKIKAGLEFEAAAKEYSSCPSKAQGGNLGSFARGSMVPEFEEAAFNLPLGELSKPVKTQFGYHIIKVYDKSAESYKSLNEVHNEIYNGLLGERQNFKYKSFTDELKKKYNVE